MVRLTSLGKLRQGFTLVEIMVALFIMSVSTMMLLANYPDSTVRLTLLNYSHSYALLLREAQIKGGAVDSSTGVVGGYGVLIDSATSSQSILFSDSAENIYSTVIMNNSGLQIGDGVYDKAFSPADTVASTLVLKEGFTFKKLCVASSTATENSPTPKPFLCNTVNGVPVKTLTVSFVRPSQVAHVYINGTSSNEFDSACIELYSIKSPTLGHIRSVRVFHSGVITTVAKTCD